jgi:hypothetical protein
MTDIGACGPEQLADAIVGFVVRKSGIESARVRAVVERVISDAGAGAVDRLRGRLAQPPDAWSYYSRDQLARGSRDERQGCGAGGETDAGCRAIETCRGRCAAHFPRGHAQPHRRDAAVPRRRRPLFRRRRRGGRAGGAGGYRTHVRDRRRAPWRRGDHDAHRPADDGAIDQVERGHASRVRRPAGVFRRRAGRTPFDPEGASSAGSRDFRVLRERRSRRIAAKRALSQATSMVGPNGLGADHRFAQASRAGGRFARDAYW